MKHNLFFPNFLAIFFLFGCNKAADTSSESQLLKSALEKSLKENLLNTWYPKAVDWEAGGYFSDFTYDFQLKDSPQEKMIVTQARHLWSNSKAALRYPEDEHFKFAAEHGFKFLKDKMWDKENGVFFQLVDRYGNPLLEKSTMKTAYGNSFGIYALAAYFEATGDSAGLELAIQAFRWMENHSHDPVHKGYFQHLDQGGNPVQRKADTPSTSDLGYKDQNSSIHLLEAFTELYHVWKDPLLKERLEEMLLLVRDTITHEKGYLVLFFEPDWTPVTFKDADRETILRHKNLDHVSFGHDVETGFLLIESAHALGWGDDEKTIKQAKKMIDHALNYGWDNDLGGFYDEGYYFKGEKFPEIIKDSKNWWAQAEGMNALLVLSTYFPDDEKDYFGKFRQQWDYIQKYLIDHEHGDWYPGGLDKQPQMKTADKGHIWKANYHQFRAMAHSIKVLGDLEE
ncbi:AGE family epimerase/isomerase [Cecembia calidifontis]|uniref:Mannobiose 2-epimerase n=1 Tax=Cecembia calidifontis TaxID=1187080 RepID=A0A4Q7PB45_9BACT|nr:AGE family epimerase/isomerase [Cecembia calidifontis]RZS97464.1 mannobiose 2-epimerase [Cecembia calidifontis]